MADGVVILGGFVFQDFEVPDALCFGGKHIHKTQIMVGGQRVVDAMGPDADEIHWKGRFRGAAAIGRASAIKAMMDAGAAVILTWLGISRTVLITHFEPITEKFYEVTYTIVCTVVDDPSTQLGGFLGTLDSVIGGDMAAAGSLLGGA